MAVFSTNQVRQLYVSTVLATDPITDMNTSGAIRIASDIDEDIYFQFKGADTVLRSDLIKKSNIKSIKATSATNMKTPMKRHKIVLDPQINGGEPVIRQDYILRISFLEWVGLSPEDTYYKFGSVVPHTGMTSAMFYKELKKNLELNFSKESTKLLNFELDDETTPTCLYINEEPQPWVLGLKEGMPLNYIIQPVPIIVNGDDYFWGVVTKEISTNLIGNGKKMADLEYFCMGFRGDMYRNMGFPNVLQTKYLVNPSTEYDTIDIQYSYIGDGISTQASDKTLTLVIPSLNGNHDLTNSIIAAINAKIDLTIKPL